MTTKESGSVRVLIVEDSPTVLQLLIHAISRDRRLAIVGSCGSAEAAFTKIRALKPDVISLDVKLPGMDGVEATRRIMKEWPTPIVVVTGLANKNGVNVSMEAMRAGALAVVKKPDSPTAEAFEAQAERLCDQLYIMSQVKVIRQRTLPSFRPAAPPRGTGRAAQNGHAVLGIAASTGGPPALVKVLNGLRPEFAPPIVVVQHMGTEFLPSFAKWLGSVCSRPVRLATADQPAEAGNIYVAPGDFHLTVDSGGLHLGRGKPVCNQRPSADVLFQSLAANFGPSALGVLLTGMGEDGARGLLALRRAGGYTIAEDISTAVVYGMPGAAAAMGAAIEELPIDRVADGINRIAVGL
jgi:two-component system, chemotaxis family, protein-glutamate methylesterase/glutaminase